MQALTKHRVQPIRPVPAREHAELLHIWEKSEFELLGRASLAPLYRCNHEIRRLLLEVSGVYAYPSSRGAPVAFVAVAEERIALLDVLPDYRYQGIGSALLRFAVQQAGAREVELPDAWTEAQAFYRHHGFTRNGPTMTGLFRGSRQTLVRLACPAHW